ncbi:MAG: alpha,2-mannosyltransferase, partial [Frankiaceae bacterium]|nr:alpha,2-mannosyltransferase [Frankiaceae bacterium]
FAGRRRDAVIAAGTAVALSLAAAAVLPNASATYWTGTLWHTERVGDVDGPRNRSLWGLIGHTGVTGAVLLALACTAVLTIACLRANRAIRNGRNASALAIAGMASVAVSPISWSHHLVWLIPAEAALLAAPGGFGLLAVLAVLTYRLPVGSAHVLAVLQGAAALLVVIMLPAGASTNERHRPAVVGMAGFEPTTSSSRTRRATKLRHIPLVRRRV